MKNIILLTILYIAASIFIRVFINIPPFILLSYVDRQIEHNFTTGVVGQNILAATAKVITNPIFTIPYRLVTTIILVPLLVLFLVKKNNWFKELNYHQIKKIVIVLTLIWSILIIIGSVIRK